MLVPYFLIAGGYEAWLCSNLDPIQQVARFADLDAVRKGLRKYPPRPGSPYSYMESCEIDCDIHDGVVTKVRELIMVRGEARHRII